MIKETKLVKKILKAELTILTKYFNQTAEGL